MRWHELLKATVVVMLLIGAIFLIESNESFAAEIRTESRTDEVIRINGDSDFAAQASANGWPGDGSESSPYIISGYHIDAHAAGAAIYIGNTTVHFIVENCVLEDTAYHSTDYGIGAGITLFKVENGILRGNVVKHSHYGFHLYRSSNNIVEENVCGDSCYVGVRLDWDEGNRIRNNDFSNSSKSGIYVKGSRYDIIENNVINNQTIAGIYILRITTGVVIANNTLDNNTHGIYPQGDLCYFVGGKIVNNVISNSTHYGVFIPQESRDMVISGNRILHNGKSGIYFGDFKNMSVEWNTFYGNGEYGIYINAPGGGSSIYRNNFTSNTKGGAYIRWTKGNSITSNVFYNHPDCGLTILSRDYSIVRNEFINNSVGLQIIGAYSHNVEGNIFRKNGEGVTISSGANHITVKGNEFEDNSKSVAILGSHDNYIEENGIEDSGWGIYLSHSYSNRIENNTLRDNIYAIGLKFSTTNQLHYNRMRRNGIYIYGTSKSAYTSNVIPTTNKINNRPVYYYTGEEGPLTVPHDAGEVILGDVRNVTVEKIDFDSTGMGVVMGYSSNITVRDVLVNHGAIGIISRDSSNITVERCRFENLSYGMLTYSTVKSIIRESVFRNNTYGMYFTYLSGENRILNNIIERNTHSGIYGMSTRHNVIMGGRVSYNRYGFNFNESSTYNLITGVNFTHNSDYAIYFWYYYGDHNMIYNNSFYYNRNSTDKFNVSHVQAYSCSPKNYWNSSAGIGNYWHDWANNNDTNDKNHNSIVDWPYLLDGHGAMDYYPLKNVSMDYSKLVPSVPQNLEAEEGAGYVNLSWDVPASNGSAPLSEYRIYRNDTLIATVPATQLWYNDTNVSAGIVYGYHVTAVNSMGESEKSNRVTATPSGEIPELSWLLVIALFVVVVLLRRR